jgi:hypothetical protein
MTLVFSIPLGPEIADGLALGKEDDNEGRKVCEQSSDDGVANVREARRNLFREDAKV